MELNFIDIVIGGYLNEGKYFSQFIYRQWKEAERTHYSKDVFFGKCRDVAKLMEQDIRDFVNRELNDVKHGIYALKTGAMKHDDSNGRTLEDAIKDWEDQMTYYTMDSVSCNLMRLTDNRWRANVTYQEIIWIREQLNIASLMDEPQQSDKQECKRFIYEKSYPVEQIELLFILLKVGGYIPMNTDEDSFKYVFGVEDRPTNYNGLRWIHKQKNLCVYLVSKLFTKDNLSDWRAVGEFGVKNAAQVKTNYECVNKNGKPRGAEMIDRIIDQMLT